MVLRTLQHHLSWTSVVLQTSQTKCLRGYLWASHHCSRFKAGYDENWGFLKKRKKKILPVFPKASLRQFSWPSNRAYTLNTSSGFSQRAGPSYCSSRWKVNNITICTQSSLLKQGAPLRPNKAMLKADRHRDTTQHQIF